MTTHDQLTRGERLALSMLVAGQVLSIFTWYLGAADVAATIGGLMPWIRLLFAIVASAALDLVVVTTTTGRRDGRRSPWSWAAILAAAVFSSAIALDVAGGPSLGPWLHVCYAINIFLFAQHVAHPRVAPAPAEQSASAPVAIVLGRHSAALAQHEMDAETLYEKAPINSNTELPASNTSNTASATYPCRYCGTTGLTKSEQLAHGRARKRSGQCGA